jgi:hypothetical protein
MVITLFKGYPDRIGKRYAFAGVGSGPSSYSQTTKDPVSVPVFNTYIDVLHGGVTVSGTYIVRAVPSVGGVRATWKLTWVTASSGTEVSGGVDLSAERIILGGFGGMY